MNQRTQGHTVCSRVQNELTGLIYYVSEVPGDGGVDWGYTKEPAKALPLNQFFTRRFVADCRRVNARCYTMTVNPPKS